MADTKVSALTAATSVLGADEFPVNEAGTSKKVTASLIRQYVGAGLSNSSTVAVSAGYAADTYLAGSAITIPVAGGWRVSTQVHWLLDMVKTAAGVATPIFTLRMGTLGTTGDASIMTFTFAAGTAAVDTGVFDIWITFRTVGSGTSAVIQGVAQLVHLLTTTGLSNNTTNESIIIGTSAGFNSTTQTIIGLSFNGGASFSGTNTLVRAVADNI